MTYGNGPFGDQVKNNQEESSKDKQEGSRRIKKDQKGSKRIKKDQDLRLNLGSLLKCLISCGRVG